MSIYSTSKKLLLGIDGNGNVFYEIPFATIGYKVDLQASVVESLTVPKNVDTAFFSYGTGSDVWVDPISTAALPTNSFVATTADLNPVSRPVVPDTTLSFISETNAAVKVSFYKART